MILGPLRHLVLVGAHCDDIAIGAGATVRITGEAGNDPRSYRVDFSRLRATLPEVSVSRSIADGARELVAAYRDRGFDSWMVEELGRVVDELAGLVTRSDPAVVV